MPVCPFTVVVTGIKSVPLAVDVPGANVTAMEHIAPGASVPHALFATKLPLLEVTGPIVSGMLPVFETVTVCCVAAVPAAFLKSSSTGLKATPGSDRPNPASDAVAFPLSVVTVSTPLRTSSSVGVNATARKHDAPKASVPLHACPPLLFATRLKSPLVAAELIVATAPDASRLVSVKTCGADELLMLTGPKSCAAGDSSRPLTGSAVAISVSTSAFPPETVLNESVATCVPAVWLRNCTPR